MLAMVAQDQGDSETARVCWEQSLALSRELDSTLGVTNCLMGLALLAAARAEPAQAARLLGAAAALRETIGFVIPPSERADHERVVEAVRAALGEAEFTASWDAGRALSIDEAVALAQQRTAPDPAAQTSPARLTSPPPAGRTCCITQSRRVGLANVHVVTLPRSVSLLDGR